MKWPASSSASAAKSASPTSRFAPLTSPRTPLSLTGRMPFLEDALQPAGLCRCIAVNPVERADDVRVGREHHARLEPAGMCVRLRRVQPELGGRSHHHLDEAVEIRVAGERCLALVLRGQVADEAEVAAVRAEDSDLPDPHPLEAFEVRDDELAIRVRRHRHRAREREVVRREPAAHDRRHDHRPGQPFRNVPRQALAEQRVGRQRQVRAVLLERCERDEPEGTLGTEPLGFGPCQVLELDVGHFGNLSSTGTKSMS